MTEPTIRPLPILTVDGELPAGEALLRLRLAKKATGYLGLVIPCKAVLGSPGPILAVGCEPDWLTSFALVPNLDDVDRLTAALTAILINPDDPRLAGDEYLLSKWFGAPVTYKGTEHHEPSVQL